tara:strand:- start:440 stop:1063 length:624 start_codon:yes stop_codon:yes gene_type:complete
MSLAFAQHLQDFGSPNGMVHLPIFADEDPSHLAIVPDVEINIEDERTNAYQEGYDAAIAALTEQHQAAEHALKLNFETEKANLEAQLGDLVVQQFQHSITSQIEQQSEIIKAEVGKVLTHVVSQSLAEDALAQLQNLIKSSFQDNPNSKIRIEGPQDLIDRIQSGLGADFKNIELTPSENIDLTVEIDRTLLVTKFGEWQNTFGDKG